MTSRAWPGAISFVLAAFTNSVMTSGRVSTNYRLNLSKICAEPRASKRVGAPGHDDLWRLRVAKRDWRAVQRASAISTSGRFHVSMASNRPRWRPRGCDSSSQTGASIRIWLRAYECTPSFSVIVVASMRRFAAVSSSLIHGGHPDADCVLGRAVLFVRAVSG